MDKQTTGSFISGAVLGALAGGLIGMALDRLVLGLVIGSAVFGIGEALTTAYRPAGKIKPFWYRLLTSTLLGAAFGALAGRLFPEIGLIPTGLTLGLFAGLIGLRWVKIGMGLAVGAGLALLLPGLAPVYFGGLVIFTYRVLNALLFPGQEALQLAAEQVPKAQVRFVVPFEANSNYIGADYFKDLARDAGGAFNRNLPDIGIVETMETLRGTHFDPGRVHPLIREFYEHTSRFKLAITPEWDWRYRPLFAWFKRSIAAQIGQANLPFDQEEAQRGVVSYIDTIDFACDDLVDLRGWVRAYPDAERRDATGEAIYVGIYTTFRFEDIGYVSVGFPLPASNFTATLLPYNLPNGNFLLKSADTGLPYPGHYLSSSGGTDELVVLKLPTFNEAIEVFVEDGQLRTEHRFYIGRRNFLKLHYEMG